MRDGVPPPPTPCLWRGESVGPRDGELVVVVVEEGEGGEVPLTERVEAPSPPAPPPLPPLFHQGLGVEGCEVGRGMGDFVLFTLLEGRWGGEGVETGDDDLVPPPPPTLKEDTVRVCEGVGLCEGKERVGRGERVPFAAPTPTLRTPSRLPLAGHVVRGLHVALALV